MIKSTMILGFQQHSHTLRQKTIAMKTKVIVKKTT